MNLTAPGFLLVALVTLVALGIYFVLTITVGRMRLRHNVTAPATSGPPEFERALRIQANTLEQLVPFLVAMWLCAIYLQPLAAALGGTVWIAGRIVYAISYRTEPAKRRPGFAISALATAALALGALVGVVLAYLRQP